MIYTYIIIGFDLTQTFLNICVLYAVSENFWKRQVKVASEICCES